MRCSHNLLTLIHNTLSGRRVYMLYGYVWLLGATLTVYGCRTDTAHTLDGYDRCAGADTLKQAVFCSYEEFEVFRQNYSCYKELLAISFYVDPVLMPENIRTDTVLHFCLNRGIKIVSLYSDTLYPTQAHTPDTSIESLALSFMHYVPDSSYGLAHFRQLREILLSTSGDIPASIVLPDSLEELFVLGRIKVWPKSWFTLAYIRQIVMIDPELEHIPPAICSLSSLNQLDIRYTRLGELTRLKDAQALQEVQDLRQCLPRTVILIHDIPMPH
ncbi:MAG: hypothetical protein SF053_14115 [Bacteroidia bacterium]|nr:hypothetical protein [Bacteroidia bacterium]